MEALFAATESVPSNLKVPSTSAILRKNGATVMRKLLRSGQIGREDGLAIEYSLSKKRNVPLSNKLGKGARWFNLALARGVSSSEDYFAALPPVANSSSSSWMMIRGVTVMSMLVVSRPIALLEKRRLI